MEIKSKKLLIQKRGVLQPIELQLTVVKLGLCIEKDLIKMVILIVVEDLWQGMRMTTI